MKSNWTPRWWARIHATLVWRRFRERAFLRAQRRSRRDARRSGQARLDGLARLEPRMLLAADIATDRFDYSPGSTALFTTFSDGGPDHNFQVGETIQFQVVRTDGLADSAPGNLPWQVTDGVGGFDAYVDKTGVRIAPDRDGGADGRIETDWFVGSEYANASLEVRAFGLTSGETATEAFHDSAIVISANMSWSEITTGSGTNGAPTAADTIVVNSGVTLTVDVNGAVAGAVTLGNGVAGTAAIVFSTGTIGATFGSLASNGTARVTFNNVNSTLTVGSANTSTTFGGTISGAGSLTKVGTGGLTLTAANTYSGGTRITGGFVAIGQNNGGVGGDSIGPNGTSTSLGAGTIDIAAGASLHLNTAGLNIANAIILNGMSYGLNSGGPQATNGGPWNGAIMGASLGGVVSSTLSGTITLNATSNITTNWTDKTLIITGKVTGPGGLVIDNSAPRNRRGSVVELRNPANDYQGDTTVQGGNSSGSGANPTLRQGAANAIPSGPGQGNLVVNGQLDGGGFNLLVKGLSGSGAIRNVLTLQVGNSDANGSFSGIISGNVALTKVGAGTLTLSGTNTYTGGTNITGGILAYGASHVLSNAGSITVNGGTLALGTSSDTVGVVSLVTGAITSTTGILTGSSYVVQSGTISAILAGSGTLTKTGAGTVTLSGTNTYTGGTTVSGGVLRIDASNILADSGAVTLNGGTLELGASSDTIGSLTGPGTVTTTTGVLTVTGRVAGGLATGNIGLQPQATFSPSLGLQAGGMTTVAGLTVTGTVDLGGSSLDLAINGRADVGQAVTIVANDGSDPIIGGFAGLPDGRVFLAGNGQTFRIDYAGGDGNDIVVTRVLVELTVSGITVDSRPYNGGTSAPLNLLQATLGGLGLGDTSTALVTAGVTGAYGDPNAGANKPVTVAGLALTGAFADNYVLLTPDVLGTIDLAQISIQGPASVVYSGLSQQGVVVGYGINGETFGSVFINEIFTDAGVHTVTWQLASQDSNYADAFGTGTFTIEQADATVNVTPYVTTYDGQAHFATGTVTGVLGEDLTSGLDLAFATAHVNAGVYSDLWTFSSPHPNYRSTSGSIANTILKATPSITVTPYTATADGQAHTAIGVATGVNGEDLSSGLNLQGTTHSAPGIYSDQWSFISPNGNYIDVDPGMAIVNTIVARVFDAPIVVLGNDTGISDTDGITSDGMLAVTGVEVENMIEYSIDAGQIWSGAFTALEGGNVVLVRQFDGLGGVSPAMQIDFTLDTQAAADPMVSLTSDTGTDRTDLITSLADLTIGNVESGATVEYSVDSGQSWNPSFSAVEGTNVLEVRQVDVAGNVSPWTPFEFTLDTGRPVAPVTMLANDTGSSPIDRVTSDGTLMHEETLATLFGTGVDAAGQLAANWATDLHYTLVSLPGGSDVVRVATADNGYPIGAWISATGASSWIGPASDNALNGPGGQYVYRTTFDLTGIDPGSVSISGMWAADDFGAEILINGTSEGSATWNSPGYWSFETFTVTSGFVDGINTLDFVLVNGGGPTGLRVEMTGTVSTIELDGTVEYSTDNGSTWRTQWTPDEGLNQVLLRQVDPAGNASDPTRFAFTLDTQAAADLTVALASDTGTDRTDLITSLADLIIGNVESGATVEYSVDGGQSWSPSFSAVEGMNVLEVRQVDVGGNVSPATHFEFTLDTSPLTVVLFYDGFGTLMPDGINATTTLDFSACTVPLTFTLHPNGSLTVEDTTDPSANGLTFGSFGDIVGGQAENRFVFVGSAAMAGRVIGNAMATNTLDYSESSLAVSVDLGLGLATRSGGFEGINAVIGSAANGNAGGNTLIGPGGGSVWTIESLGGGSVGGVVFSDINDLVAVASSDTLDYSLFASAVTVNLALGAATGFRQITGFRNVVGTLFDDSIVGDASDNTFAGLSGNDTFLGGAGTDTVVESADVDFTLTATTLAGIGTDSLASIEAVSLSAGASANTFTVDGWTGSASLTGGAGNDSYVFVGTESASVTIVEGADADTDTLDFTGLLNGGVSLDLAATAAQTLVPGLSLTLSSATGIENVIGTALADTLLGNGRDNSFLGLAGADTLVGRSGDDTFIGSAGNDSFDGGTGTDMVIESADVDFTLASTTLTGLGTDALASIERVNLTAGASANTLTVQGWTGSATLTGGSGNDRYVFAGTESASVTIVEGAIADTDTLDFTGLANGGVSLDLAATAAQTLVAGLTLTLSTSTGIENVIGTALADTLQGNTRDNTFAGLAGDDAFSGLPGNDTFDGGAGTDTIVESADVDFTLTAAGLVGIGSDALASIEAVNLSAGASANTFTLQGWTGNASLTGGAGNDSYVFVGTESASVTIVEAANADTDTLDFTNLANGGVTIDLAATTAQALASGLTLTLSTATGIEDVIGTALADTLGGNARDNRVSGLAGDDTLSGRAGADSLDGGAGVDAVVEFGNIDFTLAAALLTGLGTETLISVESIRLAGGDGANTFTLAGWAGGTLLVGGGGSDRYVFRGTAAANVTLVEAADADTDTLDFSDLANGAVNIDLASTAAQVVAAGLTLALSSSTGIENVIGTALADALLGNTRDNLLSGLAGNDTYSGLSGNDSFIGGTGIDTVVESADVDFTLASTTLAGIGSDSLDGIETLNLSAGASANTFTLQGWTGSATLTGGGGSDSYVFSGTLAANVTIVEGANSDSDTLDFSGLLNGGVILDLAVATAQTLVSGLTLKLSSGTGIENVIGSTLADTLLGNSRDNTFTGLAGADTLVGRAGDDSLVGSAGNDSFDGGTGTDTVTESADVAFTLASTTLTGLGTDTLASIERVNLTAGTSANTITLQGWTGSATLTGGSGNDRYVFAGTESANVTIVEGASADTDTLDFTDLANGGVSLDLASTAAQSLVAGLTLTLSSDTGIENVIGTALADVIVANTRDNVLSGLAGDDTLSGRLGNDTVDGGSGTDRVVESGDVDFTLASALLTGVGSDTLAGIETVNLAAGAGANTFTVDSWTGNASLTGGAGNDSYVFTGTASANVTIIEVANADTDTLDFTTLANEGVSLDLTVTTAQTVAAGLTLTLSSETDLENVIGTAFADTLLGNTRDNVLSGLAGDDTLSGRDGNDTFDGGAGRDVVAESADVNFTLAAATLTGAGSDTLARVEELILTAGIGANTFTVQGWTGSATLTGAAGNDRYVFAGTASAGVMVVEAAAADTDTLDFSNLLNGGVTLDLAVTTAQTLVSGLTLTLSSATGIENVTGTALADTLLGNARGNLLAGLAGDDSLTGRGGNDSLDGGSGSDTVIESGNVDFTLTAAGLAGRGTDLLAGIETVSLTGGAGANTITVDGWNGSAVLSGDAGNDTYVFTGTESASVTIVEAADADSDTLDFSTLANGGIRVDLAVTPVQTLVSGLTLTLSSSTGIENVTGTAFADSLVGNTRANTLAGLSGDDVLTGRVGDDTLDGGSGSDTVVESADVDFALASSALTGLGTDALADVEGAILSGGDGANSFTVNGWTGSALLSGAAGDDVYAFVGTLSTTVTIVEAADADADTLDFTSLTNGGVNIDLAVTTTQTAVTGLTVTLSSETGLENVIGSAFADVLLGNTRANTLSGLGGDDTLTGLAGDDTFAGGDGTDTAAESADIDFTLAAASLVGLGTDSLASIETVSLSAGAGANTLTVADWAGDAILSAGAGNDFYVFTGNESGSVTIVEAADADTDTLDFTALAGSAVSLDLAVTTAQTVVSGLALTLSSDRGIENVIGTALADTILGNARDNTLLGLTGDDALAGRAGDDTLVGGVGNDNLDGGDGTDTVVASADVDFTLTPTTLTGLGTDTLTGVEGAILTAASGANTFTVQSWTGSAVLSGGAGSDIYAFSGTLSASVTIVEAADVDADTLDVSGLRNGGVTLDLAVTTAQTLVAGLTVTLASATGIENVNGTAYDDTVRGNSRDNNLFGLTGDDTLSGRAGDDTFTGGAGNDNFDGGLGTDTVIESGNVDFTLAPTTLTGLGTDSLAGIEMVSLTAGSGANTFTLSAWTGSAILSGAAGNDRYVFTGTESASVTIVESANADTDSLDFSDLSNGGVSIDLAVTTAQTLVAGLTLTLSSATGIENVIGTAFTDTLVGNTRDNSLLGLAGDDTLSGGVGNDTFGGGAGTDTVVASADVDFTLTPTTLTGLGTDSLTGVEVANLMAESSATRFTVQSWTGSAILSGGAGNDTYVFSGTLSASVTIVEMADGDTDTLDASGLLNGGVTLDLAVTTAQTLESGLTVTLSSATGIENVIGTALADTLQGNARDNVLSGLAGDDTLAGRAGDDTFTGGAGDDRFDGSAGTDTVIESGNVDFTLAPTTLTGLGTDTLTGIESAALTAGSGANTFTLSAWTGSAILSGAAGSDRYVFTGTELATVTIVEGADADADSLDFSGLSNGGVSLDLAATMAQSLVAGLTLTLSSGTGIEDVIGTALADTILGNARANAFSGIAGNDMLAGRAGNDRYVFAGTLSASVTVVEGADADADTLDFSALSNGGLALDLGSTTPQSIATGLTLTLSTATGIENADGTAFADALIGNSRDNVLSGLAGDDRLDGASGTDTVVESADVDFTLTPSSLTGVGSDTLTGIEAARLTAGASQNTFTVNAWAGNATLTGGTGNDRYVFVGAVSASIAIVEDAATDTDAIDFSALSLGADTGVNVDLALTSPQSVTATLELTLSDATGIENVTGTASTDTMLGNARDNAITGLGGDDTLGGRAGSNTLVGGAGTDTVIETGNVDATVTAATITGVGSDVLVSIEVVALVGGSGANTFTVNGWEGSLILEGGLGNDSYVFVGGTSTSVRIVEVANADSDTLDFSAVTLTGGAGLTVDLTQTTAQEVTGGLFVTLFDAQGIENVFGSNAADTMSGNSRDNLFRGLSGQDTIDGRAGTDTFVKAFGLVDVIINDSSLIGSGTDSFHNIEVVNVTLGSGRSGGGEVGVEGRILDASMFNGTLIADFRTDSLEITRSATPSGVATSTLIIPALLESLSVASGTIYLGSEINTGATGSVSLDSSGAIIDDNDPEAVGAEPINNIVAVSLVLRAVGGIGSDNVLDTQVSVIDAKNSGSGHISILNQKNVHGPVDVVALENSAGSVAVENYGDDTHGITVSGTVRASGEVVLISHSPLTIDGSIQSTSDREITLEADTLSMSKTSQIVTTGDVAMNSRIVKLTGADMADAKIKNSRNDAQIDVSGGSFNTLTSTGKGTQIDFTGGSFNTLTSTGAGSQIDFSGGAFNTVTVKDASKIDFSGGSFNTLASTGAGSQIDFKGGAFNTVAVKDASKIDFSGGSFNTVAVQDVFKIDFTGGTFNTIASINAGSQIDFSGGSFNTVAVKDASKIDFSGGSFNTVAVQDVSKIDFSGGSFNTVVVNGSGGIDVGGGTFEVFTSTGSGTIQIHRGTLTVDGAGDVDIPVPEFGLLVASGSGTLGVTDGSFSTVIVNGLGGVDCGGGTFNIVSSSGPGRIDITGGTFNTLNASGSGGIDIRGGAFKVGVNSTGSGNVIDITGATLASLYNSGAAAVINVSGASFESITNSGDNVTITVVGDAGSNALINSGNDVTISFAAGAGDDVFVNDGRGDGNHGSRVALTIDLGAGRDRAVLGGTSLTGSIAGGAGDDTFLFVGGVTGTLALGEAADLDTDTLDFSSLAIVGGVGVTVDLSVTTTQVVTSGLSLTLSSGSGFEDAVGSSGADTLRGNARDNALFGSDLPDDRLGTAATTNGRVQLAYLDFDSETDPSVGDHEYTTSERAAVVARLAAIYSAFRVEFVLDVPTSGDYATIKFNKPRPNSEDSGGWASEVDFGNRSYGGIATVDVNGLLDVPGGPVATSATFVASSAWLAAHELSHLLGLRHADSFGPPGFGIEAPPGRDGYLINPAYVGPAAAWETDRHIIETPALTGFTLWDLVAVQFFGEREAIKLVYNDMAPMTPDGKLFVAEQALPHGSRSQSGSQELVPVPLAIPNTLNHGLNAGKDLMAGAVNVLGELTATGELDIYRMSGRRGDLLNIQVMSAALARYKHSSSALDLDAVLTVYDEAGNAVALSDDEFETHDPSIIDLVLPVDGVYYIEVKGFYHDDAAAADTGSYELFLSRFDAASRDDVGDVLEGRSGNDTLVGGRGDDTYVFEGTVLGNDTILEDLRFEKSGIGATGSSDGRDSGDTLDFTNFGTAVSIDLTSTAVQVVAAGDLSLRLSSAVDNADEPVAAEGIERVLGSALGNALVGNARANTFVAGGAVNTFQGADAADTFQLGGGSNTVDGGVGIDAVTLPGSAADYTIAISGSTVTITSLPGVVPASVSILTSVEVVRFTGGGTATFLVGVGDGFTSVQAAVNAAVAGDTILVAAGNYAGAIDIDKEDLTLVSAAGSAATTLLGAGATATVAVSAAGVTIRGFGIDNASVAGGSAILLRSSAAATIDGNVIRNAVSGVSHVVDGGSAEASITGNTFASTVQSGVAGTVKLALAALSGNTFRTSVEAINLGSGVSLTGNALDRAGIFALLDAQTLDLSGGVAIVDSRSNTVYAVATPSVAEHLQAVGTVPTTGLTGAATFAVIAGVDAGLFQIDGSTGELRFTNLPRFTAPADVGADNVAEVIVRATDSTRNVVTRYTVSVFDVNVAPEFAAATRVVNLAENISVAGVAAATDWDLDTLGYSIAAEATDNADGARFTIHPVSGVLAFKVAPDFENLTDADRDGSYQVRVAATDPGGLVSYQIVTVVVSDTNDNAPVFTSAATATVVENTAISNVVYTASRTDGDATAAFRNVSYSIKAGVGDGVRVAVNAATGAVTLLAPADYETKTSYLFVVVADDGLNRAERIVTLNVIDTNDNAPLITSAATGSVTENTATTATIYTGVRTDADVTAAFRQVTWSIMSAVGDAAMVAIQSTTGVVTLLASADYETKTSYVFTVVASDGLHMTEKTVTVNVVDANDRLALITSGATGSVTENAATTTVIYTATRTDADVTAAFRQVTYSVKAAVGDAAQVSINATSGAVTLLATADYETKASYLFTIIVSDGLDTTEQAVTVNVIDVNDNAPMITSATTGTVVENVAAGTVIYTATRTDADVTAAFRNVSYSIKPLVGDAAKVIIDAATGAVTLLAPANYETKTSYLFTVVADDGINRAEKAVTVAVTDLNDNAPVITSAATGSVTENAATTTTIYTATRTDADVTAAFRVVTYSIKPGVGDAARVAIHAATGAVKLLASADYETKTSYLFTVIADDGVNRAEKVVTVSVVNIDDTAATFTSGRTASVVASATLNPAVYTATVNDSADVSQGVAFSLATADATLFAIHATTGVVTVKGSTLAMKGKTYTFTVTATDKGGAKKAVSQVITLTVA